MEEYDFPVAEYSHSGGHCSVTGGYVYRGSSYPRMEGVYFYADYCSGNIWGLQHTGESWQNTLLRDEGFGITSFGEDEAGNLYLALGSTIYELTDSQTATATPTPTVTNTPTNTPTPTASVTATNTPTNITPTATQPPTSVELVGFEKSTPGSSRPVGMLMIGLLLCAAGYVALSVKTR
jgi:hypothetical protein